MGEMKLFEFSANITCAAVVAAKTEEAAREAIKAWERCRFVDEQGIHVLPMWFHGLDQMEPNIITEDQASFGWTDFERRRIMQWFYWHKKAVA